MEQSLMIEFWFFQVLSCVWICVVLPSHWGASFSSSSGFIWVWAWLHSGRIRVPAS